MDMVPPPKSYHFTKIAGICRVSRLFQLYFNGRDFWAFKWGYDMYKGMNVYVYTYIHMYIYIYVYMYICICIYIYTYIHLCILIHVQ